MKTQPRMKKNARKRVGILGGSFDPVHRGHIGLATGAREKFKLDHILFIPAYLSPHKLTSEPASPRHRLAMLKLALGPYPFFSTLEIELEKRQVSFTIDTLSALTTLNPDTDFFLIIGKDAFLSITTWKSVHRLWECVMSSWRHDLAMWKELKSALKVFAPDAKICIHRRLWKRMSQCFVILKKRPRSIFSIFPQWISRHPSSVKESTVIRKSKKCCQPKSKII